MNQFQSANNPANYDPTPRMETGGLQSGALGQRTFDPEIKVGQVWHARLPFSSPGSQLHTVRIAEITERTVLLVDPPEKRPSEGLDIYQVSFEARFEKGAVRFIERAQGENEKLADAFDQLPSSGAAPGEIPST